MQDNCVGGADKKLAMGRRCLSMLRCQVRNTGDSGFGSH